MDTEGRTALQRPPQRVGVGRAGRGEASSRQELPPSQRRGVPILPCNSLDHIDPETLANFQSRRSGPPLILRIQNARRNVRGHSIGGVRTSQARRVNRLWRTPSRSASRKEPRPSKHVHQTLHLPRRLHSQQHRPMLRNSRARISHLSIMQAKTARITK